MHLSQSMSICSVVYLRVELSFDRLPNDTAPACALHDEVNCVYDISVLGSNVRCDSGRLALAAAAASVQL